MGQLPGLVQGRIGLVFDFYLHRSFARELIPFSGALAFGYGFEVAVRKAWYRQLSVTLFGRNSPAPMLNSLWVRHRLISGPPAESNTPRPPTPLHLHPLGLRRTDTSTHLPPSPILGQRAFLHWTSVPNCRHYYRGSGYPPPEPLHSSGSGAAVSTSEPERLRLRECRQRHLAVGESATAE